MAPRYEPEPKAATAPAPVVVPAPASRRAADRAQEGGPPVVVETQVVPPLAADADVEPGARTPEDVAGRRTDPGGP